MHLVILSHVPPPYVADTTSELAPSSSYDDRQPSSAALPQLLLQISKPGTSWVDKVQLYGSLAEGLQGPGSSPTPEVAANIDRVAACLLDGIGELSFMGLMLANTSVMLAVITGPSEKIIYSWCSVACIATWRRQVYWFGLI